MAPGRFKNYAVTIHIFQRDVKLFLVGLLQYILTCEQKLLPSSRVECCLTVLGLSKDFQCQEQHPSTIRLQNIKSDTWHPNEVDSQPGDCRRPFLSLSGVFCV